MLENSFYQSFKYHQITETTIFFCGDFSKESKSCPFICMQYFTLLTFLLKNLTDAYHTIISFKYVLIITY